MRELAAKGSVVCAQSANKPWHDLSSSAVADTQLSSKVPLRNRGTTGNADWLLVSSKSRTRALLRAELLNASFLDTRA